MKINIKVLNILFITTWIALLMSLLFLPLLSHAHQWTESMTDAYVYPNPATPKSTPKLRIQIQPTKHIQTRIYDISGLLVYQFEVNQKNLRPEIGANHLIYEAVLPTHELSSGIYLGVISGETNDDGRFNKMFRFTVVE